jgi:hypothetical protein
VRNFKKFVWEKCEALTSCLDHPWLKSWLKNLSNEYIYAEQNTSRTRDISFQSWPFRSQSKLTFSHKFSLWGQVPEKWQVTRDFMLQLFLSWGIDYWIKNKKSKFGRITSRNFVHPISLCVPSPSTDQNLKKLQGRTKNLISHSLVDIISWILFFEREVL